MSDKHPPARRPAGRRDKPQLPVTRAFSAGGVLFRWGGLPEASEREIVLVGRTEKGLWALPKGTPHPGETPHETALREVREETGLTPRIVGSLGVIAYSFLTPHARVRKRVRHYLMEPIGGDLSLHDHEYDAVAWYPIETALEMLTHENEAIVVRRAVEALARRDARQRKAAALRGQPIARKKASRRRRPSPPAPKGLTP